MLLLCALYSDHDMVTVNGMDGGFLPQCVGGKVGGAWEAGRGNRLTVQQ